jgi:hypothetical protein
VNERPRLPVAPERLKEEFPELTEEDLGAYAAVTKRVLADPHSKGRIMREVVESGQAAERKLLSGEPLAPAEVLALRYLRAVAKMQRSTVRRFPERSGRTLE